MNALIRTLLGICCLAGLAQADAPMVFCECGGGPTTYAYYVDSASYPMIEFCVGTNDLNPANYTNVLVPLGWAYAIEAVGMHHSHGTCTPHGEFSPGPCWCLTKGRIRWYAVVETEPLEFFTFGFNHPWTTAEDIGFDLLTRREGPPPEEYLFNEMWDVPVGTGYGPLHGPYAPPPAVLRLGPVEFVSTVDTDAIVVPGYSVPSTADWNNDGLPDLIVGEGGDEFDGRVRIYLNIGIAAEPQFADYSYAMTMLGEITVPPDGCQGTFPRVVYWDGDMKKDLLIGMPDGTLMLYLNINTDADPIFDMGTALIYGPVWPTEEPLDVGLRAAPCVVDANNDGRKDLVVGALDGKIHVFLNDGDGMHFDPEFNAELIVTQPDGNELVVPTERSSPEIRDLDGDGLYDILTGNTEGHLLLYHGPLYEDYTFVESAGVPINLPDTPRSRPFVCDWTGDGWLDVLIGAGDGFVRLYQTSFNVGDLNCDGSIDFFDIEPFVMAITAPSQYVDQYPFCDYMLADCNGNGSVDFFDIDAFMELLITPTPHVADYWDSGCLPGTETRGGRDDWCDPDEIEYTVEGTTLQVLHHNAAYNCCPDDIVISMTVEGDVLHLTETEILTMPCDCICCYDVEATIVDLAPGTYTVELCWFDYDTWQETCDVQEIVVPTAYVADYWNSGCLPGTERGGGRDWCEAEVIEYTVEDGTLGVLHQNAMYNCCLDDIVIALTVEGDVLHFTEEEILTDGCYCLCCFDAQATVEGLAPGTYTAEFCWFDYDTWQQQCDVQEIVVP